MQLAKVIGDVVTTRKDENLVSVTLLVLQPIGADGTPVGRTLVAVERALETEGRGLILLSRAGERPLLTAQARRWLAAYFGRPLRRSGLLPAPVETWAARQRRCSSTAELTGFGMPLLVRSASHELCLRFLAQRTVNTQLPWVSVRLVSSPGAIPTVILRHRSTCD